MDGLPAGMSDNRDRVSLRAHLLAGYSTLALGAIIVWLATMPALDVADAILAAILGGALILLGWRLIVEGWRSKPVKNSTHN